MKKWTIAFVNYKTSVYMKWQLKGLYKFNDPSEFNVIIVDNSNPHEITALNKIIKSYQYKHKNIEIIYHNPQEPTASGQHGEALTLALKRTKTKYFLTQDPDFFWVKQNYLKLFETYLESGKVAIGAPYPNRVGVGHPWFPCAYGCAHITDMIKDLDFHADASQERREESFRLYPLKDGFEFSFDVGWKIREKLSNKDDSSNFISFGQRDAIDLKKLIGVHSYGCITKEYLLDSQTIAFHLFRGSFTDRVDSKGIDANKDVPQLWTITRDKFGKYFYENLCENGKISLKRQILNRLYNLPKNIREARRSVIRIRLNKNQKMIKLFGVDLIK